MAPAKKEIFHIPVLLLIIVMPLATAQSLQLVYRGRSGNHQGTNRILLECQRNTIAVSNPQIFVERSDLPRQSVTIAGNEGGRVAIEITQDLEGLYSCSDSGDRSTTLELVAYPQANLLIPSSYTIQAGLPATIDCQIMPGKLSRYYSVRWMNGSVIIATSNPHSVLPGYQLHDNFSLTINDIQPSDSSASYQCSVTIDDPQRSGTTNVVYNQLSLITVVVYERPTIQTPLRPRVEVIDANREREVTFSCTARGGPRLTLSWTHNGANVNPIGSTGSGKYRVNGTTEDGSATSMLTMNQLRSTDSGSIACIATVTVFIGNSQTPETFTASTSTSLSILAGDFDLDVDITTAGDVLLQLTLLAPVPGEVQLRIKYTSSDSTEPHTRTSNEAYINASRIIADVRNSDVPYQRFKVQVALIIGNQQGPFVPESLDSALTYDKNQPTQVDNTPYIVIVAGGLILAVVIAVVIAVVVVTYCSYKKNKVYKLAEGAQAAKSKVFEQAYGALRDPNVTPEKFKLHIQFLKEALPQLNPIRIDAGDEEEDLHPEIQQEFLEFLRSILRGGKRDKLIGPKIINIIKEVFANELDIDGLESVATEKKTLECYNFRDEKVSLENFQMHINFINRAFLHLCIDSDEEKELDFEMQQCFLDFLRNILLRGKRDKTIGPEIAQVVRVVFGKELSDGRLVEETTL